MSERSYTPRDIFADILEDNEPQAVAWVRGDAAHPALSGMIKFYKTPYQGVLIEAEVFGLPDKDGRLRAITMDSISTKMETAAVRRQARSLTPVPITTRLKHLIRYMPVTSRLC